MMTYVSFPSNSCILSFSKPLSTKPFIFNPSTRPFSRASLISSKVYLINKEANQGMIKENFDFKEYYARKVKSVNHDLDKVVPLKEPQKIYEAMRYSLLSDGKRVLPTLCIAACELVGGQESAAMPAACAIEMILTMGFIHDDLPCADNDDIRRGKPTNHKAFGESTTLFAGDALLALAFEHITNTTDAVPASRILLAIRELAKSVGSEGICGGQVADLETSDLANKSMEQVDFINLHKTVAFAQAAAVIGAILGGGSDEQIEIVRKYAKCFGMIFQVVDDIHDIEKDMIDDKVTTYPKLVGIEKSWEYVEYLSKKANNYLVGFDQKRATSLISFTNYLANR